MSTWPVTPSFAFSAGVLDVQTPQAKMRIQWLPYPTAEEMLPSGRRWRTFWPEFRLLRPHEPAAKRAVYALDLPVDDAANVSAEQKATAFALFRNASSLSTL
jgi:hypothetical protein